MPDSHRSAYRALARSGLAFVALLVCGALDRPAPSGGDPQNTAEAQAQAQQDRPGYGYPSPAPVVVNVNPNQQPRAEEGSGRPKDYSTDWWMFGVTVILAFIACVQVAVFRRQARRLYQTIDQMRQSEIRELRAYVFVTSIDIANVAPSTLPENKRTPAHLHDPTTPPKIRLFLNNSGKTPAYDVIISSHMFMEKADYKLLPHEPPDIKTSKTIIAPGGSTVHNTDLGDVPNITQLHGIMTGAYAIFINGKITYKDAFGKDRWTRFAFFHNSDSGTVGETTEVSGCTEGNEADQDIPEEAPEPSFWDHLWEGAHKRRLV